MMQMGSGEYELARGIACSCEEGAHIPDSPWILPSVLFVFPNGWAPLNAGCGSQWKTSKGPRNKYKQGLHKGLGRWVATVAWSPYCWPGVGWGTRDRERSTVPHCLWSHSLRSNLILEGRKLGTGRNVHLETQNHKITVRLDCGLRIVKVLKISIEDRNPSFCLGSISKAWQLVKKSHRVNTTGVGSQL